MTDVSLRNGGHEFRGHYRAKKQGAEWAGSGGLHIDDAFGSYYVRYMAPPNRPRVDVEFCDRKSTVLSPSDLPCLSRIPTINLTAGCAYGCTYCYIQGYRNYPGPRKVVLYVNTVQRLKRELGRRRRPAAVYFSPSSDLFQPIAALRKQSLAVLELLLSRGIGVVFLTKGNIPELHRSLLREHRDLVCAQVGITTLDEHISSAFEPMAASPAERIDQIAWLISNGIATLGRIDPILPGVGDDAASLEALMKALAGAGLKRASASVLFLRASLLRHLKATSTPILADQLVKRFGRSDRIALRAGRSIVTVLPLDERRAILDRLRRIAATYEITVLTCACKNPDLAKGSCGISGNWDKPPPNHGPSLLFAHVGG